MHELKKIGLVIRSVIIELTIALRLPLPMHVLYLPFLCHWLFDINFGIAFGLPFSIILAIALAIPPYNISKVIAFDY